MSTWYSKHVEENIWRINNIKCITLVFCMINAKTVHSMTTWNHFTKGYAGPITWKQVFVIVYVALNCGSEALIFPNHVYHYWSAIFSNRNVYSIILPLTVKYLKIVWNSNLNKTWGSKNQINVMMLRMCQFRESFQHSSRWTLVNVTTLGL